MVERQLPKLRRVPHAFTAAINGRLIETAFFFGASPPQISFFGEALPT
jgi:hypothetical protein